MSQGPARVLILEDEPVLRANMAKGVSKLEGLTVATAGTVDEALALIDREPPALILSDLDLPGRSGIELIGELAARKIHCPIVFISAYLRAYRSQIPPNAHVEVLEKPMAIEALRDVVRRKLAPTKAPPAPFGIADYLQLAGMGRHSALLGLPDGSQVVVYRGQLWSARDPQGEGVDAFLRLAITDAEVQVQALLAEPGPRKIEGGLEELLLEAARLKDERQHEQKQTPPAASGEFTELQLEDAAGELVAALTAPAEPPPPAPAQPEVKVVATASPKDAEALFDEAVGLLFAKRLPEALELFERAQQLSPDDRRVGANIRRLKEILSQKTG